MKIAMKTLVAVLVVSGCLVVQRALAEENRPSCSDLRDENNKLACNLKAYRAWLSAGKDDSSLDSICHDDLVQLPKNCNMTLDFEEKLKVSERHMNQQLLDDLKEYLNEPLIEVYLEEHPEPGLHLGNRKDGNCCQSTDDFPIRNVTDNLIEAHIHEYLVGDEKDPLKVPFEDFQLAVGGLLGDHLLKPCGRYLHVMDDLLFGQLKGAVKKFMQNDWTFLSNQSDAFRKAVFRYQFCSNPDFRARVWDNKYDFYDQESEEYDSDSELSDSQPGRLD